MGMMILKWVASNKIAAIAIAFLLSMSLYAGVQKIGRIRAEAKVADLEASLATQNAAIERLASDRDRINRELTRSREEAREIIASQDVRLSAILNEAKASDCSGNVRRLIRQIELGGKW